VSKVGSYAVESTQCLVGVGGGGAYPLLTDVRHPYPFGKKAICPAHSALPALRGAGNTGVYALVGEEGKRRSSY
jgi:hypothetical protein